MSTAEVALLISVISVLIAGLSLGWNIYRDVILKAKIRISFKIISIIQAGNPDEPQYVNLEATNFGPGSVNLSMIDIKNSPLWRKLFRQEQFASVMYDYENPLSGKLPFKLDVGEKICLYLRYSEDCLLSNGWSHVGIRDYFGRTHWATRKDVSEANKQWRKDFR